MSAPSVGLSDRILRERDESEKTIERLKGTIKMLENELIDVKFLNSTLSQNSLKQEKEITQLKLQLEVLLQKANVFADGTSTNGLSRKQRMEISSITSPNSVSGPALTAPSPAPTPHVTDLLQIIENVQREKKELDQKVDSLQSENRKLRLEIRKFENSAGQGPSKEEAHRIVTQLSEEREWLHQQLQRERETFGRALDEGRQERDELRSSIRRLQEQVIPLQQLLLSLTSDREEAKQEVDQLRRERQDLSSQAESMMRALSEVDAERDHLQAELDAKDERLAMFKIEAEQHVRTIEHQYAVIQNLEEERLKLKNQLYK